MLFEIRQMYWQQIKLCLKLDISRVQNYFVSCHCFPFWFPSLSNFYNYFPVWLSCRILMKRQKIEKWFLYFDYFEFGNFLINLKCVHISNCFDNLSATLSLSILFYSKFLFLYYQRWKKHFLNLVFGLRRWVWVTKQIRVTCHVKQIVQNDFALLCICRLLMSRFFPSCEMWLKKNFPFQTIIHIQCCFLCTG